MNASANESRFSARYTVVGFVGALLLAAPFGFYLLGGNPAVASSSVDIPSYLHLAEMGDGGVLAETVELSATSDGFEFWTGNDQAGNECLITAEPATEYTAFTCVSPVIAADEGIVSVSIFPGDENGTPIEVHALPETVDSTPLEDLGYEVLDNNVLLSTEAGANEGETIELVDDAAPKSEGFEFVGAEALDESLYISDGK